ncbi:MAG: hypothetical protein WCI75_19465, partial [candidate division NC10 bacterium]
MMDGLPASRWRVALPAAVVAAAVFAAYASSLSVINALLHCANAWLFAAALGTLGFPGAGIAFFIFALHPVHAESVAWTAEPRNLLCASFYLLSFLSYWAFLKKAETRSRLFYAASLALFLCAFWSRAVACTLPAAILLLIAFKERRLSG